MYINFQPFLLCVYVFFFSDRQHKQDVADNSDLEKVVLKYFITTVKKLTP